MIKIYFGIILEIIWLEVVFALYHIYGYNFFLIILFGIILHMCKLLGSFLKKIF